MDHEVEYLVELDAYDIKQAGNTDSNNYITKITYINNSKPKPEMQSFG